MIGHCGVVNLQRSSVSSGGSFTTSARPVSKFSELETSTRLHTIQPGLLIPRRVPPPRRQYIGG